MSDNQFPPPHPNERVTTRTAGSTELARGPKRRRRVGAVAVVIALVLIPLAAVGTWLVLRDDEPTISNGTTSSTAPSTVPRTVEPTTEAPAPTPTLDTPKVETPPPRDWPTDPRLRYSIDVGVTDNLFGGLPEVSGTADDLFIAEAGDVSTTLTHYVDGTAAWETEVGLGDVWSVDLWGDMVLVETNSQQYGEASELTRVDRDDGSILWSIQADSSTTSSYIDDRLFVLFHGDYAGDTDELAEVDVDSGEELKRITGANYYSGESGFLQIDAIDLTVQFIGLDLEPVGDPVTIEPSGVTSYPWVVRQLPDGVMYVADRTIFGGSSQVVGMSWDGEMLFECDITIVEPNNILLRGDTIVVASFEAIEVFDVDGSGCTSRWHMQGTQDQLVSEYGIFPTVATYDTSGEYIDFVNDDSIVEVLDWQTGDVVATGEGDVFFRDEETMATMDGAALVARSIDSGDELWRIELPRQGDLKFTGDMIVVTTPGGTGATVDIYAD